MTNKSTEKPAAEILGYKLLEHIGSGGFGEVWSVEAPGGLKKALKIVYGFHDEKRAQAELKALDRVKSLRHPFLLSLERIEVFEGQLIVVTELADASLADHFNRYVTSGETGIPRDEMLSYMSHAAEALDFLSVEKSLQHLDVKPENILLVGKHAKVADFGLMKDLKVASQSLMQGMTPAYAAPELFDGNPASSSDQYSLAIMYAEMVSGMRPFPGTTPAQLAAQHVHGKPNLRHIPRGDQGAVARALSKDPLVRYPNCTAFVEDLKKQRRAVRAARKRIDRTAGGPETLIYDTKSNGSPSDVTEMASDGALPFQPNGMIAVEPPNCDGSDSKVHPTLIVTIGNTANRVGQKFKEKLLMRAGDTAKVPSIQSLFIDSDRKALAELEDIARGTVRSSETIEVPLRKPEDYRSRADILGWLGRRWIYNIPRTLQTEGLRPLGRLALVDHFTSVCDQLERVIGEFSLAENLAKTADELNLDPAAPDEPKVYIISSISGGLGSGMTLDLAYTIKLLLAEKGLHDDAITGILLHSSYQRSRDPGLSAANAFAFLTELRHFNEYGYPGDENLGIPDFKDEAPFQQVYYTELGDDLNQSEFDTSLDEVAEYLSLSITTPCNDFFESCRESEAEMDHFALRTFGVAVAGDDSQRNLLAESLCHKLIQRWNCVGEQPENLARHIVEKLDVSLESIQTKVQQHYLQSRSVEPSAVFQQVQAQFHAQQDIDAVFNPLYGHASVIQLDHQSKSTLLVQAMEEFLTHEPLTGQSTVSKACYGAAGGEDLFLGSIEGAAMILNQLFTGWLETVAHQNRATEGRIDQLQATLSSLPRPGKNGFCSTTTDDCLSKLCIEKENEFVGRYIRQFVEIMINDLLPIDTFIGQLKHTLQMIDAEFAVIDPAFDQKPTEVFNLENLMLEHVESRLDAMAETVAKSVYRSLIEPEGGFHRALMDYSIQKYSLPAEMRAAAMKEICNANDSLSVETLLRENACAPEQMFQWLNGFINRAKPMVNDCGGRMSMLIATPIRAEENRIPSMIESNHQLKNVAISGTSGKIAICFEAEDLSLASVAFRLLVKRPDAVELVKRIHTRSDINWTSLDDLL